jgi:hypothetical protein
MATPQLAAGRRKVCESTSSKARFENGVQTIIWRQVGCLPTSPITMHTRMSRLHFKCEAQR